MGLKKGSKIGMVVIKFYLMLTPPNQRHLNSFFSATFFAKYILRL